MTLPIILASASPARLQLLQQIGITPDQVIPADIDEVINKGETPQNFARRMSFEKAQHVASQIEKGIIIGADTVPVCRRQIMRKAKNEQDVRESLEMISQRRHRVYTGVTIIRKDGNKMVSQTKLSESLLKVKKLTKQEIDDFCASGEGIGKAGGYTLTGKAESFVL
ncbi:MAG: hypothetical protein DGJ47_000666, partial [Rickettsiaceae bacterium]